MLTQIQLLAPLLLAVLSGALPDQRPLIGKPHLLKTDVIHELEKAEIIPNVLNTFIPKLNLSLVWANATSQLGNTVPVDAVQKIPDVYIDCSLDNPFPEDEVEVGDTATSRPPPQLTIALTDPDAPSRDNPEWSEICHWIVTTKPVNPKPLEIMPYKPPGPPPKTGKHRYVFVVMAPKNGTREKLYLEKPDDRRHWGFGKESKGLSLWAEEMGLEVVGANFVYAQNEEQ